MSLIGSFARGEWDKGLAGLLGGTVGEQIYSTARGEQSFGQMMGNLGKAASIQAPIAIATMGVGAAAGAAASGITKAASGATGVISKVAQGASTALNAVSKVAGTGVQNMSKEAVGQTVKAAAVDSVKNMTSGSALGLLKTAGSKVVTAFKGATTGSAANTKGYMGELSSLGQGTSVGVQPQTLAGKLNLKAPTTSFQAQLKAGSDGSIPGNTIHYSIPNKPVSSTVLTSTKNSIKNNITPKGAIEVGLSLLTTVAGAKQAKASNAVAQQSLNFQKQSYQDAKDEREATKAQLKQDALNAYNSTQSFAASLAAADSNNTLLTSYNTNGTGNEGTYSILSWSSKKSSTT